MTGWSPTGEQQQHALAASCCSHVIRIASLACHCLSVGIDARPAGIDARPAALLTCKACAWCKAWMATELTSGNNHGPNHDTCKPDHILMNVLSVRDPVTTTIANANEVITGRFQQELSTTQCYSNTGQFFFTQHIARFS